MKISLNWLKEYLDLEQYTKEELAEIFTLKVCEIEEHYPLCQATNLTIGLVVECISHPNSDHLHITKVALADGIKQIVCGAPNVASGQKVIVANPGAVLPGGIKIKESSIRGVESSGMICSLKELGIEDKYLSEEERSGIYILDKDAPVGEDALAYLGLDDYVYDLHLTPNRGDLLSMEGVAYDLAAALDQKIKLHEFKIEEIAEVNPMKIEVEAKDVYQYNLRYIDNLKVSTSPWWLKSRLITSGIRPINNIVDITNYILLEYGQPLHAFDQEKVGLKIVVRNAFEKETMVTLDKQTRDLKATDVVITDGKNPLCLGGVMGGLDSEVTETTTKVALEAAIFDPKAIRLTATRLQLRSESSHRFERRIDDGRIHKALDKAAVMFSKLASGRIYKNIESVILKRSPKIEIKTTLSKINNTLGTNLSLNEIENILQKMAFEYWVDKEIFTVNIPSRRIDYDANEQDLFEDIARFYGLNNIAVTLPKTSSVGGFNKKQKLVRNIRQILSGFGLNETVNYSLIKEALINDFVMEKRDSYRILLPFTEERTNLRLSLISSLLDVIAYNKARKLEDVHLFEVSNTFSKQDEKMLFSGASTGLFNSLLWQQKQEVTSFFLIKGILDFLFAKLNLKVEYRTHQMDLMHPGKTATILLDNKIIGFIGELNPKYLLDLNLNPTIVFEIDLNLVLAYLNDEINYTPVSKYPFITRDLALVIKDEITVAEIIGLMRQTGKNILKDIKVFDVYSGPNIPEGHKSIAFQLLFSDEEKTLEAQTVDKIINSILHRLDFEKQIKIRQ